MVVTHENMYMEMFENVLSSSTKDMWLEEPAERILRVDMCLEDILG